jgi:hypothetical protein
MIRMVFAAIATTLVGCQLNDDFHCIETLGHRDVAAFCGGAGNHLEVPVGNAETFTVETRDRDVLAFQFAVSSAPELATVVGPICDNDSGCRYDLIVTGVQPGTITMTLLDTDRTEIDDVAVPIIP